MQVAEQSVPAKANSQCPGDDRIPVIGHETIDGRQKFIADRLLFRRRLQQSQHAGKTVIAAKNAMNIPVPAMRPNSETPR